MSYQSHLISNHTPCHSMLPAYFINLDRDVERRAAIEAQLRRQGIEARRLPAVNGLSVPSNLAPLFAIGDSVPPLMTAGEIGCYASHLSVCQEIASAGCEAALVLEDDALLSEDFVPAINEAIAAAPNGWDFILLCGKPDRAERRLLRLQCGRFLVRYSRIPGTTTGYIISAGGARKLLNPRVTRIWPVDWDTRMPWVFEMDTYGVSPPPIQANKQFGSTIGKKGGRSRLRTGLPRPTTHSWTNNPIRTPASFMFNVKKLGIVWWLRCFVQNCGVKFGHSIRALRP